VPKRDESVTLDRFRFTVLRADKRRVHLLRMDIVEAPVVPDQLAGLSDNQA